MDLKSALQKAMDFEQKGHDLYVEAAENTRNPVLKKTFGYLAKQEIYHKDAIKTYMQQEHPELNFKNDSSDEVKEFFSLTGKQFKNKLALSDDDVKAHEAVLKLEKSSYDFYKKHYEGSPGDSKKFFEFSHGPGKSALQVDSEILLVRKGSRRILCRRRKMVH